MPLRFLVDENLRGPFWNALQRATLLSGLPLDVVCVGETDCPALGTGDADILLWTESQNRLLITRDKSTMPAHLANHLASEHTCPGIFMIRDWSSIPEVVEYVCLAAELDEPDEWHDRIQYIPDV